MKSISGKELIRIIQRKGWVLRRVNGSHHIFTHPLKKEILSVPVHKNEDLKIGLLRKLMSIADVSENEL